MKRTVLVTLICALLLMGCTYKVYHSGYDLPDDTDFDFDSCDVTIIRDASLLRDKADSIGAIQLAERGFTINCDEKDALLFLKKEACLLGANAVKITSERRAALVSSCYRPTATFLKTEEVDFKTEQDKQYYSKKALRRRIVSDKLGVLGWYSIIIGVTTAMVISVANRDYDY